MTRTFSFENIREYRTRYAEAIQRYGERVASRDNGLYTVELWYVSGAAKMGPCENWHELRRGQGGNAHYANTLSEKTVTDSWGLDTYQARGLTVDDLYDAGDIDRPGEDMPEGYSEYYGCEMF